MTAPNRIDWKMVRESIDLAAVISREIGEPPGRRGARSARPWWSCPFHDDPNPSMTLTKNRKGFRCYGCGAHGDAVGFILQLFPGMSFPEAVAHLTGNGAASGRPRPRLTPRPALARPPDPEARPKMTEAEAAALVADAERRLWTPEGAEALAYLRGPERHLTDATIRAARLGWTPRAEGAPWKPPGVVLSWWHGSTLALVKLRPPAWWRERFPEDNRPPKYIEAYRNPAAPPGIYPGPEAIRPGRPLVIAEGEFDALLLAQELSDLAAVVTLGSASGRPDDAILGAMLPAWPRFVATDADDAGDKSADAWPASFRRVRPPTLRPHPDGGEDRPKTDWTDLAGFGVDLRRWWGDILAGNARPPLFTWPELAALRWGPSADDPTPGIMVG